MTTAMPVSFDFDVLVDYLAEAGEPTAAQIEDVALRMGRNYYPAIVQALFWSFHLTVDAARIVVPAAWSMAEFPMAQASADEWRELFDLAGYTEEGKLADRPTEPLTLWRGARPTWRDGWSWTDDLDLARWFAARPLHGGEGRVWRAAVHPSRLFARISEQRQGESEYVVYTPGLHITAH